MEIPKVQWSLIIFMQLKHPMSFTTAFFFLTIAFLKKVSFSHEDAVLSPGWIAGKITKVVLEPLPAGGACAVCTGSQALGPRAAFSGTLAGTHSGVTVYRYFTVFSD